MILYSLIQTIHFLHLNEIDAEKANYIFTNFNIAIAAIISTRFLSNVIQFKDKSSNSLQTINTAILLTVSSGFVSALYRYLNPFVSFIYLAKVSLSTITLMTLFYFAIILLSIRIYICFENKYFKIIFNAIILLLSFAMFILIIPLIILYLIAKILKFNVINLLLFSKFSLILITILITIGLIFGLYHPLLFVSINISIAYTLLSLAFFGRLTWSWWFYYSILPSVFLIISALYLSLINYWFNTNEPVWYVGIISGLVVGLIIQYILKTKAYQDSTILITEIACYSNQGIRESFIEASIVGVLTTFVIGTIENFSRSVSLGLIFWLLNGGMACIQHLILRLILYSQGYIPWDYTKFLNYATERNLLQRIGGSYKFIHGLLQEHFVNIPIEANSKK